MERNVARLEEFKNSLIVFPKRRGVIKAGDASKDVTSNSSAFVSDLGAFALKKADSGIVMEDVTDEMKSYKAFTTMRLAAKETKVAGYRKAVENRKKD